MVDFHPKMGSNSNQAMEQGKSYRLVQRGGAVQAGRWAMPWDAMGVIQIDVDWDDWEILGMRI